MGSQNITTAFEALKEYLIQNHNAKTASGGKEIVKRCHFCGDSRDPSQRHLYIGVKDGQIKYNCFKCNTGGTVDGKFLRDLDCYDPNIIELCLEQNKKYIESNSRNFGALEKMKYFANVVIPLSNNEFVQKKLAYLSKRMGHEFNAHDAARFKIILNLKDFINVNHITKFTRHPDQIDLIDKFFIGFLSMDNRYVIMRRLIPEGKLPKEIDTRYLNYNIFGGEGSKYYTIPGIVDISKPFDIHIAEGGFDILSIYMHVAPIGSNAIYSAICGKSYANLVKFFIMNYGFGSFNLHLYPDSDIDMKQMQYIAHETSVFNINCFVHRNNHPGEKDFGVSMDRIEDLCTEF